MAGLGWQFERALCGVIFWHGQKQEGGRSALLRFKMNLACVLAWGWRKCWSAALIQLLTGDIVFQNEYLSFPDQAMLLVVHEGSESLTRLIEADRLSWTISTEMHLDRRILARDRSHVVEVSFRH